MYLKQRSSGDLVEILEFADLFDPYSTDVAGRFHHGEEMQEREKFGKETLVFPSGEALPRCWTDPHYRDADVRR
jgi:hypothetical protein